MATISRKHDFSDLDLNFIPHPTTGDVVVRVGDEAIKRSVRNLILTNFYDRPFRPFIGSNVQKLLFEQPTPMTANFIKDSILEVVKNYEPRVKIIRLSVDPYIGDSGYEDGYNATIYFEVLNRNEPLLVTLFLERIR